MELYDRVAALEQAIDLLRKDVASLYEYVRTKNRYMGNPPSPSKGYKRYPDVLSYEELEDLMYPVTLWDLWVKFPRARGAGAVDISVNAAAGQPTLYKANYEAVVSLDRKIVLEDSLYTIRNHRPKLYEQIVEIWDKSIAPRVI